jgi:hypothetical protein
MAANESSVDRVIRAIAGIGLLAVGLWPLGAVGGAVLGIVIAIVGAVLVITGIVGFCPLYALLGIKTRAS